MTIKQILEILLIIIMFVSISAIIKARLFPARTKEGKLIRPKGIGIRLIQLVTVFLVIPSIVILALEGDLSKDTVGTLIGSIVGYILGKEETRKGENEKEEVKQEGS